MPLKYKGIKRCRERDCVRRSLLVATVPAIAIAIAGCATAGREVSEAQIAALKKGETTSVQAVQALGNPTSTTVTSDGRQVLTYSFAHVQTRPATFIPIVGIFTGGADIRSSALVLTFNQDGVLQEYSSHRSATGSGTGIAGGRYMNPDPTLPQEAK